ncbi:MAG: hypothetical protein QOH12_3269 [Solirubrobacteraceae bacterium]|jgi:hypothetical protein|nr:hypothetical protein [Solirubrobacteraceae bacterium]
MADKQVTVPVPEERVAEFYAWFASFLAAESGWPGEAPHRRAAGRGRRGGPGGHERPLEAWSAADGDRAAWLYGRLAPGASELFDLLATSPGKRFSGNEVAARLKIDKGAHGVAGILAWPGRYSRRLDRVLPIATEGRPDGGTDYFMEPAVALLFAPGAAGVAGTATDPEKSPRGSRSG